MRNIIIEDNIIDCPKADFGIYVRDVDGVRIARNKIISYSEPIVVENCMNVSVED